MGWVRKLFLSFLHTGKRKMELGLVGKVGWRSGILPAFLCSPKSCLTSNSNQLLPLPFLCSLLGACRKSSCLNFVKKKIVYCININVTTCLHYLGAYELVGHDSAALGIAWAE